MGLYADKNRITLGTYNQVIEFIRRDNLLEKIKKGELDDLSRYSRKLLEKDVDARKTLQEQQQKEIQDIKESDSLYLHRSSITTGMINIHDIAWGKEGLWVVNSTFSCLSTLSPSRNFIANWKPPFISELVPEDRCHLNGMAMVNGKPKYATTFNQYDSLDSWTSSSNDNGTLYDIETNEILVEGLSLPHSPKVYKGDIYVCESGRGLVWKIDPKTKEKTEIIKLQGFTRDYIFTAI